MCLCVTSRQATVRMALQKVASYIRPMYMRLMCVVSCMNACCL